MGTFWKLSAYKSKRHTKKGEIMKVKHGKYKWNPDLSREKWDDQISVFDCEYTAFYLNLPDVNHISIDFKHVDYEPDNHNYNKYVNPTYYIEIWWDDEYQVYATRNFQNLKGTFNRYVRHIEKLFDANNVNEKTLCEFFEQIEEEDVARRKLDSERLAKKDFARRVKNTFGTF